MGRTVELDLAELGAAGPAEVLSIGPCPDIEPDDGRDRRVITGTFRHSSGNVFELQIVGEPQPIGTTGNHPFWSEDRHAFVPAESLQTGEKLRKANGTTTTVVSLTRRSTTEAVYNLEVDVDHVYHVGTSGVLVHNAYSSSSGNNAASIAGRLQHALYNPGPTYNTRYTLPSGLRPDAVDFTNRVVRELKPNNPRAIARGKRQVQQYLNELQSLFGGTWTSFVDTY